MNAELKQYFKTIGQKGGQTTTRKWGKKALREWGKRGGRPRKKAVDN